MCGTSPGSLQTFNDQVPMPINGRVQCIDKCISQIVASLNAGGVQTVASCCGHNKTPGSILLYDGRCIGVFKNQKELEVASKAIEELGTSDNIRMEEITNAAIPGHVNPCPDCGDTSILCVEGKSTCSTCGRVIE